MSEEIRQLEKVYELLEHKNMQIDENRKVSMRIDEIEKALKRDFSILIKRMDDRFEAHLEADEYADSRTREELQIIKKSICKIEEDGGYHDDKILKNRVDELEQTIFSLGEMYKELSIKHVKLIDMELKKKPHKCPVCDGIGGTKVSGTIDEECHACEGKGIVWG